MVRLSFFTTSSKYYSVASSIYIEDQLIHFCIVIGQMDIMKLKEKKSSTETLKYETEGQLIPDHQKHLLRKGNSFSSEIGLDGKQRASRDGRDEFHKFKNLLFWNSDVLHVATRCNFSRFISRTSFVVQCFSICRIK